jgi:hypothetical protein
MAGRFKTLDLSKVRTGSVRRRSYQVGADSLARMPAPAKPLAEFYLGLPRVGEAAALLRAAELIAQTTLAGRPILWIIDGRLYECGLSSLMVYLIHRELVQGLIMNGQAAVRDYELAFHGATVENVAEGLADGRLGLAREIGEGLNAILNEGVKRGFSLGECLGRGIADRQPRHYTHSVMATAAARAVTMTVHVSIGADGFQRYPGADGALIGKGSLKDAHIAASMLAALPRGALVVALHRDLALGQVFLHSYGLARNLNSSLGGLHMICLGDEKQSPADLTDPGQRLRLDGPLELIMPLLLGALFCLVQ